MSSGPDTPRRPDELEEREKDVLRALVQEYIASGGPVGSSQLARRPEFEVSSATLRNVLADLEALGYLEKPHTSSGRVPTDRAYRFFVDTLVKLRDPPPKERELIAHSLPGELAVEQTLQEASRILHALTRHAGVVLASPPSAAVFQRIEFVRLREDRVLAILVGQGGQVQNKAFSVDFPLTSEDLVRAANYLNALLREVPLEQVREKILAELSQEQAQYDQLSAKALKLGAAATDLHQAERVFIEGAGSFLEAPEFADVERMKALFRALEQKHQLLDILDRVQKAKALQIFIGTESEFSSAGDVSVIASPYGSEDQVLGAVGVIGPTRMNYQRVIPLVNFTAQILTKVLGQG